MMRRFLVAFLVVSGFLAWPVVCPAPLVYRPGEGWTYESPGAAKWTRGRAKDQLEVATKALADKKYSLAAKAARRTVKKWPLSDYAPQAQYIVGLCYEAKRVDDKAFREYQKLIEKYPKVENYNNVLYRQYEIANRYLGGQWFKLWGYIPFFPSMEKTGDMYAKVIRNGPFSDVAPHSQLKIGTTREKQSDYMMAVKAYEKAADVYHDKKSFAAEARYRAGSAYFKQAKTAEYDQNSASLAIATFSDFVVLHPNDPRTSQTQKIIAQLRTEMARGAFQVALFYEKKMKWDGALVYYNEVLIKDPESTYAADARKRIEVLKKRKAEMDQPAK
jgi:outer membrane protein assembly factor BamD